MSGFTNMYAEMYSQPDNEKYEYGQYYFPVFDLNGVLTIEDFDEDELGYYPVKRHTLVFERYLTVDDAVHRIAESIGAHYNHHNISKSLLEATLTYRDIYTIQDILEEGQEGVRIATFVKDKSLIYRAVKEIYYA